MTAAGLRVDLALGITPFGTVAWTNDVSDLVRQRTSIRRGRRSVLGDVETGRATVTLDNRSRAYDPENTSSLYAADLKPMVPIRIHAVWDSDDYMLFQGFVADWRPRYFGGTIAFIDLICVDGFEPLSRLFLGQAEPNQLILAQAAVDQRIIDTLDAASWPGSGHGATLGGTGPRIIDNTSAIQIQASSLESVPALDHLLTVARSVDGIFFIDASGNAVFQDRSYRDTLTSVDTFGDAADGSERPYRSLQTSYGAAEIINQVTWQNQALAGETRDVVVSDDPTSQGQYLMRTHSRTSMLLDDDGDAQTIADGIVGRFKDPKVRAERIEPTLSPSTDDSWPIVLAADISTRLTVRRRSLNGGSMLELEGFIEGIDWDITQDDRGGTTWRPAWDLSTL